MRLLLVAVTALALSACALFGEEREEMREPEGPRWSLVVHGGAGVIERTNLTPDQDAQYRASLRQALSVGGDILDGGGTALDAVEATIRQMEDDPLFNAGRGAVFSAEGRNELDASIMDGDTRNAGAVAGLTHTRHPISAARAAMERSPHVMLIGEGAEEFTRAQSVEQVDPSYFFTERRWRQLEDYLRANNLPIPPRPAGAPAQGSSNDTMPDDHQFGTVGVVAYDRNGNIAAGTSTGGTTGKRWGRVGDSPIIGAGTYAQNGVCGVSATGTGEYFIRIGVARAICSRMQLLNESPQEAADIIIDGDLTMLNGDGGVIVVDGRGRHAWSFNTPGMYRASLEAGGNPVVYIFGDEE